MTKVYRIISTRCVIQPGYARRWVRRNWFRAICAAGWFAAGIGIREAVAATRPEHWHMGSEIVPMLLFMALGIRCALGEVSPRKRGVRR